MLDFINWIKSEYLARANLAMLIINECRVDFLLLLRCLLIVKSLQVPLVKFRCIKAPQQEVVVERPLRPAQEHDSRQVVIHVEIWERKLKLKVLSAPLKLTLLSHLTSWNEQLALSNE